MIISDIDFSAMYRRHMQRSDRPAKLASAWDAKAKGLSAKVMGSDYTTEFVSRMDLAHAHSLLDIGCGPGTIGLALAPQLQHVVGLDYSPGMLECMQENATALALGNVQTKLCAWEDDWLDIPVCDIAVASRSSIVPDMAQALAKMTTHARLRCYMTHLVGGHFGDAEIAAIVGKQAHAFPDYIYIVNILFSMGFHPSVDYIEMPSRLAGTRGFAEFVKKASWSFGELDSDQLDALKQWYDQDPKRASQGGQPMRWAFISWNVS
ncbi:class I SAM-dependent methyltransferase [Alcaligenaceae bacterium]|nr:class I SAM-dependent methyltransferase [Alcaligenaceae bacterium]